MQDRVNTPTIPIAWLPIIKALEPIADKTFHPWLHYRPSESSEAYLEATDGKIAVVFTVSLWTLCEILINSKTYEFKLGENLPFPNLTEILNVPGEIQEEILNDKETSKRITSQKVIKHNGFEVVKWKESNPMILLPYKRMKTIISMFSPEPIQVTYSLSSLDYLQTLVGLTGKAKLTNRPLQVIINPVKADPPRYKEPQ